jgi:hypothetical protein
MNNILLHPKDLTYWLQKIINDENHQHDENKKNEIIFDRCSDYFEFIINQLNKHNLHLAVDNKILMIKLCRFFYENSYV